MDGGGGWRTTADSPSLVLGLREIPVVFVLVGMRATGLGVFDSKIRHDGDERVTK